MVLVKEKEILKKEKQTNRYLKRAKRIFLILSILQVRKEKYFKKMDEINFFNEDKYMSRSTRTSEIKGKFPELENKKRIFKTIIFKKLEDIKKNILKQINRQERLLLRDIAIGDREGVLIEQIEKFPLFSGLNEKEKSLLEETIKNQKKDVQEFLAGMNQYSKSLKVQREVLEHIEFTKENENKRHFDRFENCFFGKKSLCLGL